MAIPICDRTGNVVGWLDRDVIRDINGKHRAFIHQGNAFNYSGAHLGIFKSGFYRDRYGHVVTFVSGARGGPLLPLTKLPPMPPLFPLAPLPPLPPLPPLAPIPSLSWSILDFEQFLTGEG
jgi:hypothetical protein